MIFSIIKFCNRYKRFIVIKSKYSFVKSCFVWINVYGNIVCVNRKKGMICWYYFVKWNGIW